MSKISGEGVNPLRPYYIPPSIGGATAADGGVPAASSEPLAGREANPGINYASRARHVFAEIDYKDYLGESSPSVSQSLKDFFDEMTWKYASVLMAQPFEVAKTILQAYDQSGLAQQSTSRTKTLTRGTSAFESLDSSDSEDEELFYFTSVPPDSQSSSDRDRDTHARPVSSATQSPQRVSQPAVPEHQLSLRRPDSVLEVIGQLWQKDGAWGVWKCSNAAFIYSVLQSLLENWSRSFLSAILNVPDLGAQGDIGRLVDIAAPYPWASLFVAGTAAVATGLLLSPLDLVRTRLILTPGNSERRRTLASLRDLPTYLCPASIALPTILNSLIHPLLTLSTPLLLRTRFMIDSQVSPMTFSVTKFCASSTAILLKLPIETALRRGQMAVLSGQAYVRAFSSQGHHLETIVPIGSYRGLLGTLYHIACEEGTREVAPRRRTAAARLARPNVASLQPTRRKGQGLEGLWRGWKVNWWGLVGLWTASVVGAGGEGEF